MSQMSTQGDGPPSEVAALKRWLALLEVQNAELHKLPVEEKRYVFLSSVWLPFELLI
jgi:hypothetical protein